jgi:phosphatidate cytidylyltransferase
LAERKLSNIVTRVVVAVAAIPLIVLLTYLGGYYFYVLVSVISSVGIWEFYGLVEKKGIRPLKSFGLAFGLLLNGCFLYERIRHDVVTLLLTNGLDFGFPSQYVLFLSCVGLFVFVTLLTELFRNRPSATLNMSATVAGAVYISLFLGMLIGARELFWLGFPFHKFSMIGGMSQGALQYVDRLGGYTIVSLFACIWICDTAAYFGGRAIGRKKLFERVSPNKTWEGAVFGFVFAILTMIAAKYAVLEYLSVRDCIVLGIVVGIFGQIGDLVESLIKRDAGVKDSSAVIPGHGGMFDRFDSLIFVSPLVYLYLDLVVL